MKIRLFDNFDWDKVLSIFFETSTVKDFKSEIDRQKFIYKYLGLYKEEFQNFFYVLESESIVGYICGACETDLEVFYSAQPHLKVFKEFYTEFPAHLHINLTKDSRGKKLGEKLVDYYCEELRKQKIAGVHIITSQESRNIAFYKKLGFTYVKEDPNSSMLFMGRTL